MTRPPPRLFSIPPGDPFLPTLAQALRAGLLIPGFDGSDALTLADVTIYLPTRRAARALRSVFVAETHGSSAILPTIKALGEFDEDGAAFDADLPDTLELPPPIGAMDRQLLLARLVRAWKRRLPAHVASLFAEEVIVPASSSDAIWHARDLARLMDEIETDDADWSKLAGLVPADLAGWWQVTLDFLDIVTREWPNALEIRRQSNPAAHRSRLIRLEAERLARKPPRGPVIAAGSTGSIPATAELLSVIARLPAGAVVLPGLDLGMDLASWDALNAAVPEPSTLGHPQFGLAKLLRKLEAVRDDVVEIGERQDIAPIVDPVTPTPSVGTPTPNPSPQGGGGPGSADAKSPSPLWGGVRGGGTRASGGGVSPIPPLRRHIVAEALRPAPTTDAWAARATEVSDASMAAALAGVTLVEAANERDEAAAIAIALKQAAQARPDAQVALVTGDRNLARRVSTELLRLGVVADDSGGRLLSRMPPAEILTLLLDTVFRPGDPVALVALLKHPLLTLGMERSAVRHAAEAVELIVLRGGTGRPDIAALPALFERRLAGAGATRRPAFWLPRMDAERIEAARGLLGRLAEATAPLAALRQRASIELADIARTTTAVLEALCRSAAGGLDGLYGGDAGAKLADFLLSLVGADADFDIAAAEWPDVLAALMAESVVKPAPGSESRIAIWGALEARLQTVDTLVLGGLNEGVWPRKAEADRFMSRVMKAGLELEPPERRIGLAAHDFMMAMGAPNVVLTRAARSGDAPAVASRWLQRLLTYVGVGEAERLKARGDVLLGWAQALDAGADEHFATRPNPKPPLDVRPRRFSVTEIETLRRDPYAIYARRILGLMPLDPMIRDPGAADRGTLFHDILHRFTESGVDARSAGAEAALVDAARACFDTLALPGDLEAIWWPRFLRLVPELLNWEATRAAKVKSRHAEESAAPLPVGATGVTLSGRADRIDLLPAGMADILDYKTGSSPSKGQAHTLLSPQLALEGALLKRGAFAALGRPALSDLAFVRLKASGEVAEESILDFKNTVRLADELADDAWRRLEALLSHYAKPETGYLSRALPFREGDVDGDYDHLARVLEWSAGGEDEDGA